MAASITGQTASRYVPISYGYNYFNCRKSPWRYRAVLGATLMVESCPSMPSLSMLSNCCHLTRHHVVNFSSALASASTATDSTHDKSINSYLNSNTMNLHKHLVNLSGNPASFSLRPLLGGCVFHYHGVHAQQLCCCWTSSTRNYSSRRAVRYQEKADHYDILGITRRATQAQVKAAYYELSKLHHPDVQRSEEDSKKSQEKFSEINEAYSVLGNDLLRRRYDRGILGPRDTAESVKKQDMRYSGKSPVRATTDQKLYDFDAFYRNHYGDSLAKEKRARAERMAREAEYVKAMEESKKQRFVPTMVLGAALLVIALYMNIKE